MVLWWTAEKARDCSSLKVCDRSCECVNLRVCWVVSLRVPLDLSSVLWHSWVFLQVARTVSTVPGRVVVRHPADGLEASQVQDIVCPSSSAVDFSAGRCHHHLQNHTYWSNAAWVSASSPTNLCSLIAAFDSAWCVTASWTRAVLSQSLSPGRL